MTDPTMPEVPPLEVLWALCDGCNIADECTHCTWACYHRDCAFSAYQAARAELVQQQEQNHAT